MCPTIDRQQQQDEDWNSEDVRETHGGKEEKGQGDKVANTNDCCCILFHHEV